MKKYFEKRMNIYKPLILQISFLKKLNTVVLWIR